MHNSDTLQRFRRRGSEWPGGSMKLSLMFFASSEDAYAGGKYRLVLECARFADRHGFHALWIPERHFTRMGCLFPNPAVLHAALARDTKRLQLRAGSVVLPLHDPIRVVEDWSMVDNLSDGRVGVSFASGWNPDDFAFFPQHYSQRRLQLGPRVDEVRRLWRERTSQVINGLREPAQVRIHLTPVQEELPIWITAAGDPRTFEMAGEMGAHVLTHLLDQGREALRAKIERYRRARERHGHDPAAGQVTVMLHAFVAESDQRAHSLARAPYCRYLKDNVGLLKGLASSRDRSFDPSSLAEEELEEFVGFLFDRFASRRGLIGSVSACLETLDRLSRDGVDEAACLLDFGPPDDLILEHLPHLSHLLEEWRLRRALPSRAPQPAPELASEAPEAHFDNAAPSIEKEECLQSIRGRMRDELPLEEPPRTGEPDWPAPGSADHRLRRIWRRPGEALALLERPSDPSRQEQAFDLPQGFLDSCCSPLAAAALQLPGRPIDSGPYLLEEIESLNLEGRLGDRIWGHLAFDRAEVDPSGEGQARLRLFDDQGHRVLEGKGLRLRLLAESKGRSPHAAQAGDWLYEIRWKEIPADRGRPAPDGLWLIQDDKSGLGRRLADALESRRKAVQLIRSSAIAAALSQLRPEENQAGVQVVLLALPDSARRLPSDPHELRRSLEELVGGVFRSLQDSTRSNSCPSLRLWLITAGTQLADGSRPPLPQAAPLSGLALAASAEYPQIWGGLIDFEPGLVAEEMADRTLTAAEAARSEGETILAWRNGRLLAPRLRPLNGGAPSSKARPIRGDASYLVSGGLGSLGLTLAAWLARQGARRIFLASRRTPPPQARAVLQELNRQGVEAVPLQADLSDFEETAAVLRRAEAEAPLAGIFHLAGSPQTGLLENQDWESFQSRWKGKVEGAWNLHLLSRERILDHFVLFSSAASILPFPGQGNHAASNAFLDALAHQRRSQGLPALSINWSAWRQNGDSTRSAMQRMRRLFESIGLGTVESEAGLEALSQLMARDSAQASVISADWERLRASMPALGQSPLLAELFATPPGTAIERPHSDDSGLREELRRLPPSESCRRAADYLNRIVCSTLRLTPDSISIEEPLTSFGLDSLMAVELSNRLRRDLDVSLSVVRFIDGSSLKRLTELLCDQVSQQLDPAHGPSDEEEWIEGEI